MPKGLSSAKKRYVYIRDKYKCWRCECRVHIFDVHKQTRPPNSATVDHLIPRRLGGDNTTDNLQTCCFKCNQEMGEILNQLLREIGHLPNDEILEIYQEILRGEF